MTRDDSQSCLWLFRKNTAGIPSFIACIAWNDSIWAVNNPQVIAEAFIYPYPITCLYIGTVAFTFHKTATTVGLETKPTPARVKIFNKHCLFAPSVKWYSRNRIASKYHYHASAYSLQTVCCHFIYLHEENANAADTDNWSRLPGWAGDPMTAGAQQPISAIAAGDSAVTPPSTLDNEGRPALRKRRRVV